MKMEYEEYIRTMMHDADVVDNGTPVYTGVQGELRTELRPHHGGIAIRFTNIKNEQLSVILHGGSYGRENALFEIMPSWTKIKGDSIKGYLTFGEVQRWINKLEKRGEEMPRENKCGDEI